MNAKKIMGAVLVALLAAALFVGAGAAAVEGDTLFFYQKAPTADYKGTWNYGAYSFTLTGAGDYVANEALPEGKYTNGESYLYLKKATATITASAKSGAIPYIIANGGILYTDSTSIQFVAASPVVTPESVLITLPTGVVQKVDYPDLNSTIEGFTTTGQYKLQVVYEIGSTFAAGTPADALVSDVVFTFNIAKAGDVAVSASAESAIQNSAVTVTITGAPGKELNLTTDGNLEVVSLGAVTQPSGPTFPASNNITIPNTGKAVIYVEVGSTAGNAKLYVNNLSDSKLLKTLTIKVIAGEVTIKTDADSYFIGNDVTLSGTTTAGDDLYVYWKGTNVDFVALKAEKTDANSKVEDVADGKWEYVIDGTQFQYKDAGTYTVYVSTSDNADQLGGTLGTYATVSLVLKQPFISVTDAPAIAVQGSKYVVTGTAEAASDVYVYVFGTNFFANGNKNIKAYFGSTAATSATKIGSIAVEDNEFEITLDGLTGTEYMAAGQYFMVIQHPMYNELFDIKPDTNGVDMYVWNATSATTQDKETKLFTVEARQTANAAQALCDALDTQNIDDMYVKLSFIVAAPTSTINPIPSEITQGSKLTVSGTTNLGEGQTVTVEMLSTAFAAVPKETVGSASFIALTTKTDENGNWEVTFDTTSLNVDEYSISVAVGDDLDKTSTKINVIEGAPTEQPTTQPTETEQPTTQPTETEAPTTPGFGALAALAGLGAVAVLLLRRE